MRLLAVALLVIASLAGCIEGSASKLPPTSGGTVGGRTALDNTTLHGKLSNSPHLNINSGMTLKWDFPNASKEKPALGATLVQFLDTYKSSHHAFDGNMQTVAFIPVESRDGGDCGAVPKAVKNFLRNRDSGNSRFGSLTGSYEEGWYHAVLVAFEPSSFTISFDAEKEAKPRTLPAADPYVHPGGVVVAGGRDLSHNVPAGAGPWLAWASATVGGNSLDGGRTHKLDVGCQTQTVTRNTGQTGNPAAVASAFGPNGAIDYKSSYQPTLAQTASTATTLSAAWVHLLPIPLDVPGASPTSNAS